MKVQEVKKQCLAYTGLAVEFNTNEVTDVVSLVRELWSSIEKGKADLASMVDHTNQINSELEAAEKGVYGRTVFTPDNATVTVSLKSLYRACSLLDNMTQHMAFKSSDLFDHTDAELDQLIAEINTGQI